ncbi:hypothetical protein AB3N04_04490 [Alkalihalophilus sp. As8PL]|uniref:Uncharacterized protein n=1 Tax=Alkalihalophilus sp. As8PL TaxID=3237103 RepID=A0AB39BWC7_9BACI
MRVYYDEIDGHLYPKLLIVPATTDKLKPSYQLDIPFERFHVEDFHDEFKGLTITLGELIRVANHETTFSVHIPSVRTFLTQRYGSDQHLENLEHFVILIDDLEELLQVDVRKWLNSD